MIKSKAALISSAIIFGICMYLYFPFPNNELLDARVTFMSFPIRNQDGYITLGIVGSALFIIAIVLLVIGLKKYHIRAVILTAIAYVLSPQILITAYQETFANGIQAISYNGKGSCNFDDVGKGLMQGECQILLHNHSNEAVSFELQFLDAYFMEDGHRMDSLMNLAGPHIITIEANEKKSIHLNELLDVSNVQNRISSGNSNFVHLKIIEAGVERTL